MSEDMMNLSINGQSQVPPGFRFHPTEEELLHYYLRKKVALEKIDLDVIREVDLNKLEPWDIQERCRIGSTPQSDWYFFSHKDKKYPTGTRTNRATAAGFWKATGRDKIIYSGFKRIGLRKTLVFYKGRAPHGQKSDWIMHEYRLDESVTIENHPNGFDNPIGDQSSPEEGWVVCRVFRKKNLQKTLDHSPRSSSSTSPMESKILHTLQNSSATATNSTAVLDQILHYMGGGGGGGGGGRPSSSGAAACKLETGGQTLVGVFPSGSPIAAASAAAAVQESRFMHLPRLESPNMLTHHHLPSLIPSPFDHHLTQFHEMIPETDGQDQARDWAAFDRLVACQLNGQADTSSGSAFGDLQLDEVAEMQQLSRNVGERQNHGQSNGGDDDIDFWSFSKSSRSTPPSPPPSDPLRHLSV